VKPQHVSDLQIAFPANVADLMPDMDEIPEDFRRDRGDARPWVRFQRDWFFKGFSKGTVFRARDGIDRTMALRHLKAIQGSCDPQHEHKEAAVAYLASLWFESPPT
jgi:hypothetical protein